MAKFNKEGKMAKFNKEGKMAEKSKVIKLTLAGIIALMGILVFTACAPSAPSSLVPAVAVIPNVSAPVGTISYVGADFEPSKKVTIVFWGNLNQKEVIPQENAVDEIASGLKVDDKGAFYIKGALAPSAEGVYAIRVYDEKRKVVASTVLVVKK